MPVIASAQITILKTKSDTIEKKETILVYDSLSNICSRKSFDSFYNHLIGQTIMSCIGSTMGQYYILDSVLPDDKGRGLYDRLCMTNKTTGEKLLLGGLSQKLNRWYVVQGHVEKLKNIYVGKKYIYVGEKGAYLYDSERDKLSDINTGKEIEHVRVNSIWTCIDVQVKPLTKLQNKYIDNDNRSPVVLVFENPQYGRGFCYYEKENGGHVESYVGERPLICGLFIDKESMDTHKKKMITKYGQKYGNAIAQNKVQLGMNQAMCRESWGEPYEINRSTGSFGVHEQWVYSGGYLYFENGKLTSIQN